MAVRDGALVAPVPEIPLAIIEIDEASLGEIRPWAGNFINISQKAKKWYLSGCLPPASRAVVDD